ncbi:MAG: TadE/TadG family type IV pilus assembly protein [Telluria sp.]
MRQQPKQHFMRGAVAVEAAIVFAFLSSFLALPSVFLAFYFYKYSAAQKAVHDAALYLSTAPRMEMMTVGPEGQPAAVTLAKTIIAREMAGLAPDGNPIDPNILCGYKQGSGAVVPKPCTTTNNQTLAQVIVSIDMSYINPLTGSDSGWWISPYATVGYVGN